MFNEERLLKKIEDADEKMILFSNKDGKKEIFIAEYWPKPEFIWPKIIS